MWEPYGSWPRFSRDRLRSMMWKPPALHVKERWDQQTGDKSQTAKQTRQVHAFHNGRDSESGRSLTTSIHMCKLDLKDAFFVIPVAPQYQEYLKFHWNGVLYKFKVAPFGLGSVPRTFWKLMKPIIAMMRRSGIRCVIYLDDLILLHQEPVVLQNQLQMTISLLQNLGFIINWENLW